MSNASLPEAATAGFKDAKSYDAHRPTYGTEAVEKFLKALNLTPNAAPNTHIVEIGAGTGKFTEVLAKREEGFEVIAIEPHVEMREGLEGNVKGGWKDGVSGGVTLRAGDAESMDVGDGWGDCAIAAQAFHWFATEAALKEIHRVLRPGAAFGMIWNVEDYNSPQSWGCTTAWEQKLNDIIWTFDDGLPRFRHQKWKDVFEKQMEKASGPIQAIKSTLLGDFSLFSLPLGEDSVDFSLWLSEDALWDRFATLSQIAILESQDKEEVKRRFRDAVRSEDVVRNEKNELEIHGKTYFAWTSRV